MPSPRDDPYLLELWQKREKEYLDEGMSRWSALKRIAQEFSLSPRTVYTWLTPQHRAHRNRLAISEEYRKKKRDWARIPENRVRLAEYANNYYRERSKIALYMKDLFLEKDGFSLLALSERLRERTTIRFSKRIILTEIAKYNHENPENPFVEVEPDLYRFEHDFI